MGFGSKLEKLSNVIGTAADRVNEATTRFRNITNAINDIENTLNENTIKNTFTNTISNSVSNVIGNGFERINDAIDKFRSYAQGAESTIQDIMNGNDLAKNLNKLFEKQTHKLKKVKSPVCKTVFNTGTFIARFKKGIAYSNRFRVQFHLPSGIPNNQIKNKSPGFFDLRAFEHVIKYNDKKFNGDETINLFCHSITFPSRDLQVFELRQHGPTYAFPQTVSYLPVTMNFYADSTMNTRRYFEIWQGAVHNIRSNSYNFYNEYVSDINIWVLDREGNPTYGVKLHDAWPVSIGQLDFYYSSVDSVQVVPVSFRYRFWKYIEPLLT